MKYFVYLSNKKNNNHKSTMQRTSKSDDQNRPGDIPELTESKIAFIEESGLLFETFGMTRMAGRVFGFLAISDMDAASFDQICEAVNASKGSISGTLKLLMQLEFVEAKSYPGDRKTYYRLTKISIATLLSTRAQATKLFSNTMKKARSLKSREDEVSDWLLEVSCFYEWIGKRLNDIVVEWDVIKDGYMKKNRAEIRDNPSAE